MSTGINETSTEINECLFSFLFFSFSFFLDLKYKENAKVKDGSTLGQWIASKNRLWVGSADCGSDPGMARGSSTS